MCVFFEDRLNNLYPSHLFAGLEYELAGLQDASYLSETSSLPAAKLRVESPISIGQWIIHQNYYINHESWPYDRVAKVKI